MSFYSKVSEICSQNGISVTALALALGFSKGTPTNWKSNAAPRPSTIKKVADYFGVPVSYFLDSAENGQEIEKQKEPLDLSRIPDIFPIPKQKKLPILGSIACGEPILAVENVEGYASIDEDIDAQFCLRCQGDSMIDARIYDGDIVYIRQQPDVDNGEIAAVLIGDEATLKRVYKKKNTIILQPANKAYEPMVYTGSELEEIRILGKAVEFRSRVR